MEKFKLEVEPNVAYAHDDNAALLAPFIRWTGLLLDIMERYRL